VKSCPICGQTLYHLNEWDDGDTHIALLECCGVKFRRTGPASIRITKSTAIHVFVEVWYKRKLQAFSFVRQYREKVER